MATRGGGQQNFGLVPEVSAALIPLSQGVVLDMADPVHMEQHHDLQPLRPRLGDTSSRDGYDTSPRVVCQTLVHPTQQVFGGSSAVDLSSCYQFDGFRAPLGDKFALEGSTTDLPGLASEKVCPEYSSSGEHHHSLPRVKLMCSFGGRILPRPGDGKLRYVGGDTRIVSVYRQAKYSNLMHKMSSIYEQPVVMKYQLPNEDLDALISIACDEDVENMMDEYDRLQASEAGSNRLRIFLFSPADYDAVHVTSPVDARNTDQIYMDAINGMPELRSVSLLPLQCPNILTAQQATDSFATSQVFSKTTHVSPTVSNPQLIPLGVQHALIQSNWQVMPRVLSVSPSSTPPSPTVSLQLNTFRQQDISDVAHSYGDQVLKGPVAHQRDVQRMDTVYRDLECVGSGNSSFNSQHDGSCRQIDSTRLSDSPKKSQLEAFFDHSHHQEQINMADPVLCRMPPMNALADSHGRLSRVVLNRNLMASKQQQTEVIGQPVSERLVDLHPLDTQQRPSDVQHTCLAPSAWIHNRETRREDFQYPDTFRPTAIDSMQAAPPSRQPDAASYNQPSLSSGSISSLHVQRPVTSQTIVHAAGTLHPVLGQVSPAALHPASGSSSPRSKLQDTNLNTAPGYQVFVGHRGLKPLNVRADPAEQLTLLSNEQAGRPQVQSPLSKPQEIQKFRQQGADALHGYMRDSLEPNTPPYPGGSPYHGQFTAFEDPITSRRDEYGLEHAHYDCAFAAHSNNLENVGRTMWTPDNEMTCIRPWAAGHKELRGDANFSLCHCQAGESNAAPSSLEKSSLNSQAASIINVGPHSLSEMMGFSTSTVPSPLFDRVRGLTTSSHVPPLNEPLFASPILLSTVTNEQAPGEVAALTSSMSPKAGNPTANPNSFFVADVVDEGQWIKGIQDGARILNDFQRPGSKIQINEGLHSGAVGGRSTDEDNEQICTPSIDTGDLIGNLSKPVVDAHAGNVEISPPLARHALDTEASLFSLPPSPHLSAGTATHGSSFLVLESLQPTCLTETSKNFPSNMQKNDGEFPESISDHDKAHIGQDANLLLPALFSKSMEPKQDLPIFDTAPAEEEDTGCTPNSEALTNVNANVDLLSTTLYAAPTLSMQNWEENMLDLKLEELVIESDKVDIQSPDEKEILALKNEALEGKRGDAPDDIEGSTVNMNPAAIAEAEAVSRGLQTIKDSDLEELRELGTGTFGTVYYGKWRGTDVAIKRIKASCFSGRPSERDRLIADFWKEAYILGQLHHPNIVAFYGVVPDGPGGTLATVTEYMVNGSLKQVLQKKDRTIDRRKRLLIIMDAAFGMEYLHGKNVVHFDLKCENLLVNMKDPQRPVCKVGDLGLSKVKHQTMVSGGVRGTLPWMAPELLNGSSNLVSEKVDVFSFGIVMWELLTGEEPYANMHYGAIIGGIVNNTLRPPVPSWCDPAWKSLMERCWSANPAERPSFLEVSADLRAMASTKAQGQTSPITGGEAAK